MRPDALRYRCAIAVMAKAPKAGRVKTRLCPPLTPDMAMRMGVAFLGDVTGNLARAALTAPIDPFVAFAPAEDAALFDGMLAPGTQLLLADGSAGFADGVAGFGRSLLHAVRSMLAMGYGAVAVLNADSPTLPTEFLVDLAAMLLAPGDRAVLGPAEDGGYYVLGQKAEHARLFAEITWSSEHVADETRARASNLELELLELPIWYDVDDRASLSRLVAGTDEHCDPAPYPAPLTAACIARLDVRSLLSPSPA